jgi:DNA-binding NarL/FixJ family response regulator
LGEAPDIEVVGEAKDGRDHYLAKAVEVGVSGFLTKEESPQRLVEAIRRAVRGEVLITREQLARAHSWRREVGERWESLTEREREVLRLMIDRQSTQQIAEALTISECTARTHIGNILGKLHVASRAEAIAWTWQHGMAEKTGTFG